ncbi:protein kinase [Streptomyces sp. NPDC008001]|uniref:protein kinase n=1 Tax=Streptomyces sp. NPDC008001 TaxID=3364804 RepID=UPI0036E49895
MDDYAGRILAHRYRLPLPPSDVFELVETRAFDTLSGQEVLVRQIPLPEVVDAEVVGAEAVGPGGARTAGGGPGGSWGFGGPAERAAGGDPAVSRALAAATAAAQVPDHPRLDQVFHVFAEGGSLWVVSELVPARPLAALLAERPLSPHRAAEVAADVLTALRALHAHGWTHRNITTRTVLICDDGRAILTGLAVGAAEEALCGYDPVPDGVVPPAAANGEGGMPSPRTGLGGAPPPGQRGGPVPGGGTMPGAPGAGLAEGHPGMAGAAGAFVQGGADPTGAPGGTVSPQARPGAPDDEQGRRPSPSSPYRDQGAAGGVLPPGGPRSTGEPWPPAAPRASGDPWPPAATRPPAGSRPPAGPQSPAGSQSPFGAQPPFGPPPPSGSRPPAGGQGAGQPGRGQSGRGQPGTGQPGSGQRAAGQPGGQGGGQPGAQSGPRQVRSSAIAAYRAGAARAAAARAVGDKAPPATPTGSSTWGGGSAASGAAPAPAPRPAPAGPLQGPPPGRNRPPMPPGARRGPAGAGNAARPDVPDVKLPGPAASWPGLNGLPGLSAPPFPAASPAASRAASVPAPDIRAPRGPRPDAGHGAGAGNGGGAGNGAGAGNRVAPPGAVQSPGSGAHRGTPPSPPAEAGPPGSPAADKPPVSWGAVGRQLAGAPVVERARQARMVVVGAVTERWAPEQAWPVQESWRLAPPVGPAADLWALGALLFRVVQGHAPYPEDSAAELVRLVCAEPPAFAEECGALRPVVESLMRKDPAERPEFEELRGWLRSLIRSAPEPEPGGRTLTVPDAAPDAPADQHRLPIVRRKGEVVRRRRGRPITAVDTAQATHGRHKKTAKDNAPATRPGTSRTGHLQEQRGRPARSASGLGRLLLGLVLLLLVGAVLYATLFMPRTEKSAGRTPVDRTGAAGARSATPQAPAATGKPGGTTMPATPEGPATPEERIAASAGAADGFTLRKDPKGFTVAVAKDWERRGENDRGQVVYAGGAYRLIVVPGRDKVAEFGSDPMAYQQDKEPELAVYRSSSWSGATGLRRIEVGGTASAEGAFNWNDSDGRQVYARNSAAIVGGRYHLLQVIGPKSEQREVDRFFEQATATYRAGG